MLLELSVATAVGAALSFPDTFVANVVSAVVVVPDDENLFRYPIPDGPTT